MKKYALFLIIFIIFASGCGIGVYFLLKDDLNNDDLNNDDLNTHGLKIEQIVYCYNSSEKYSYFYYIPRTALNRNFIHILLYTHSSPQEDTYADMEEYVKNFEIPRIKSYCHNYGYALMIIVTPRLWGSYPNFTMNSQAMNRYVMFDNDFDNSSFDFFKRPDLEFIKKINNFKQIFTNASFNCDKKIYIGGFSNGGFQANRFTILHPDQVSATAIGAAGAYIYPLKTINGTELTYPVGISDVGLLNGTNYDLNLFKKIPHLIFIGENDTNPLNDPVGKADNFDDEQSDIINLYFGTNQVERAENYSLYLSSIGMNCQFNKYKNIGHDFTSEMLIAMFEFFDQCG